MAISNYSDLKTAITTWFMARSDLASDADDIILLAEGFLNANVRHRKMETVTDLTPVSNVCTLPDDYIEYKRVVEKVSPRRNLEYITETAADELYPFRDSGLAAHFMIVGDDLTALPLSTNDIELTYYQAIPALSDSVTTNWLLTLSPNLYLHTCLMYAAELVKDDAELAKETAATGRFLALLDDLDRRGKFARAGLTIRGVTP